MNHSTETALLYLQNDFLQALDNRKAVFVLSLDLSSAFDTLDHPLLLTRMKEDYGVTDLVLNWLKTYLANRTSHVRIELTVNHQRMLRLSPAGLGDGTSSVYVVS